MSDQAGVTVYLRSTERKLLCSIKAEWLNQGVTLSSSQIFRAAMRRLAKSGLSRSEVKEAVEDDFRRQKKKITRIKKTDKKAFKR